MVSCWCLSQSLETERLLGVSAQTEWCRWSLQCLPTKLELGYQLPLPIVLSAILRAHISCVPQEKGQGLYLC